jgi:hypothetical protein
MRLNWAFLYTCLQCPSDSSQSPRSHGLRFSLPAFGLPLILWLKMMHPPCFVLLRYLSLSHSCRNDTYLERSANDMDQSDTAYIAPPLIGGRES